MHEDLKDWDGVPGIGCLLCTPVSVPMYSLGAGPACNLGSAIDKRYLPRMKALLSGKQKFAVIKFRGLRSKRQLIYIEDRIKMIAHLDCILREVLAMRDELKSRGLLNTY